MNVARTIVAVLVSLFIGHVRTCGASWDKVVFIRQQVWANHEWLPIERTTGLALSVARWTNTLQIEKEITFQVDYQLTYRVGSLPAAGARRFRPLPLEREVIQGGNVGLHHEVDRLVVAWESDHLLLEAGRQAYSWGIGYVWAPGDLFGSFAPTEVATDYKAGIESVHVRVGPANLLLAFDDSLQKSAVMGRVRLHHDVTEAFALGGIYRQDTVVGVQVVSDVSGWGVRGESVLFVPTGSDPFLRMMLGGDRQFTGTLYGYAEYYFNGFGASSKEGYAARQLDPRLREGEIHNLGQHYLAAGVRWQPSALWHVALTDLFSLTDLSQLGWLQLLRSISDNSDVRAVVFVPVGPRPRNGQLESEFGSVSFSVILDLTWYF